MGADDYAPVLRRMVAAYARVVHTPTALVGLVGLREQLDTAVTAAVARMRVLGARDSEIGAALAGERPEGAGQDAERPGSGCGEACAPAGEHAELLDQDEPLPEAREVPTSLPCPAWCDLTPGHPFETLDDDPRNLLAALALHDHRLDQMGEFGALRPLPASLPRPMLRVHRARFGENPTHVVVETYERTDHPAGPSDLGTDPTATVIRVQFPTWHGYLTAAGARRMAGLLHQAAGCVEQASDDDGHPGGAGVGLP